MAWRGTGSTAEPIGFLNKSLFGGSGGAADGAASFGASAAAGGKSGDSYFESDLGIFSVNDGSWNSLNLPNGTLAKDFAVTATGIISPNLTVNTRYETSNTSTLTVNNPSAYGTVGSLVMMRLQNSDLTTAIIPTFGTDYVYNDPAVTAFSVDSVSANRTLYLVFRHEVVGGTNKLVYQNSGVPAAAAADGNGMWTASNDNTQIAVDNFQMQATGLTMEVAGVIQEAPGITLYNNRASPSDDDAITINFDLEDGGSAQQTFAQITGVATNVADGLETGELKFDIANGNGFKRIAQFQTERIILGDPTGTVPTRVSTMTTVQRDALVPIDGDLVYNNTVDRYQYYNGYILGRCGQWCFYLFIDRFR